MFGDERRTEDKISPAVEREKCRATGGFSVKSAAAQAAKNDRLGANVDRSAAKRGFGRLDSVI